MSDELSFNLDFSPEPERAVEVSPLVRRIVAANPGPFTFKGTCSYIVGRGEVAVLDPGPASRPHLDQILASIAGERVAAIVVTHTHCDHSPGARMLQQATGAPIVGCGQHRRSRPLGEGESDSMEGSGDLTYAPDREMREGDVVEGAGWTLEALATPGHTANHLSFRLAEEKALFSGDHVMGWSTTIVAPPDGSMADFMASLEKLRGRDEVIYWPGHGDAVHDPQRLVRALIHHRRQREASILGRVRAGDRTTAQIVQAIYQGLNPALVGAARLSVFAHLEDLMGQGRVTTDGPPQVDGEYRPA
jgi:glyoxylase-like metal-dependent hydrolase (beta-lactamase superfamily II)